MPIKIIFNNSLKYLCFLLVKESIEIDWDFIRVTVENQYTKYRLIGGTSISPSSFDVESCKDAVLVKADELDRPMFYLAAEILTEMSPTSVMEGSVQNFKNYYLTKFKREIEEEEQPLIKTITFDDINFTKSRRFNPDEKLNISSTTDDKYPYSNFLVPEVSILHPFPSNFFCKIFCLPTIFYRLNNLLLAEEIRRYISIKCDIGNSAFLQGFSWETSSSLESSSTEFQ